MQINLGELGCSVEVSWSWWRGTWGIDWRFHGIGKNRIGVPPFPCPFKIACNDQFMIISRSMATPSTLSFTSLFPLPCHLLNNCFRLHLEPFFFLSLLMYSNDCLMTISRFTTPRLWPTTLWGNSSSKSTYSSQMFPLLKQKLLCHMPFAKGKTGGGHYLKICFHKGVAAFFKPF